MYTGYSIILKVYFTQYYTIINYERFNNGMLTTVKVVTFLSEVTAIPVV